MSFSPARVVALLAEQLGIDDDPSSATREERKLAGTFAHLLREAGVDALLYDFDEEIDLLDPMDDDESDPSWTMDDLDVLNVDIPSDRKRFQFSKGTATLEKCIFTASTPSSDLTILLDSWTSFRDKDAIDSSLPIGTTLETRQIPPGATGLCQPLDVYFFRPFKALVRRIQGYGFKNFPDFIAYQRDSILKVISLCYSIMRSPIFRPLIQYSWHAAGYLDSPPASRFLTPVQYCFPRTIYTTTCDSHRCQKMSFIRCPNCQKSLCFNCFVIAFHTC